MSEEATEELPLFPLHTVLFPGGPLGLRIFEPRYLDMVTRCLKRDSGFGVCLITAGPEAGGAAQFHVVGTEARIRDWSRGEDGLLQLVCTGERLFRVMRVRARDDGLNVGRVAWMTPPAPQPLPEPFRPLAEWLNSVWPQLPEVYAHVEPAYGDADWVGCRLAEILPFNNSQKQYLLEINEPLRRLQVLQPLIDSLRQG